MSRSYRRRGGMRVTASGWTFLITFVLLLLAAWNTGANLLYIVLGGVGSLIVLSLVLAAGSIRGLRVTREGPDAAHRMEKFGVTLRIENRRLLTSTLSLRIERGNQPAETAAYVLRTPPRRAVVVRMSEMFRRRGVQYLPEIVLVSGFPFGLFERWRRIRDTVEIVVYPRVISVRAGLLEQLPGACPVPKYVTGDGDEFFSLRDYVLGDDVRRVAWRISARRGSLVVKEMARQTARHVVFVIDTCLRLDVEDFDERFEETIEMIASLAVTLLNQQYTVAIAAPTHFLVGGEGKTQVRKVLDTLARVLPSDDRRLEGFAWFTPGEESARASYVFASPDPRDWGRRGPRLGTKILDPREAVRA